MGPKFCDETFPRKEEDGKVAIFDISLLNDHSQLINLEID